MLSWLVWLLYLPAFAGALTWAYLSPKVLTIARWAIAGVVIAALAESGTGLCLAMWPGPTVPDFLHGVWGKVLFLLASGTLLFATGGTIGRYLKLRRDHGLAPLILGLLTAFSAYGELVTGYGGPSSNASPQTIARFRVGHQLVLPAFVIAFGAWWFWSFTRYARRAAGEDAAIPREPTA